MDAARGVKPMAVGRLGLGTLAEKFGLWLRIWAANFHESRTHESQAIRAPSGSKI
jgi:hypothetical protein